MPEFVYDVPTTTLAIWLSLTAVGAMAIGLLIVKPIFRLLIGTGPDFNASLNYATSGFSLFYGLLLGLLTVAAYQNSERIHTSIITESTSLGALYSQLESYPEPIRSNVKASMRDYVLYTIHKEWPAHRVGLILNGGHNRADSIRRQLATFEPETLGEQVVHAEVIASFQELSSARQQRLAGVVTAIPDVLWYAVLVGAGINILLIALLKMRFMPHFVLGTITSFFLGVILFVIITLDRPLRGEAGRAPTELAMLWDRAMIWDEPIRRN